MSREILETDRIVFFWDGWPSQWFTSPFTLDGIRYGCCEQYMMACKAKIFGDHDAYAAILATDSPRDQKALGRRVRNFDPDHWARVCDRIVFTANLAKFQHNPPLATLLLATGEKQIVEASPTDRIWGIGLAMDDPRIHDPSQWRGRNWLGRAIVQVRSHLRGQTGLAAASN